MEMRYFQKGFNYSQDGPGNRLIYHLQGCNMRCPWCSNPEGMDPQRPCKAERVEDVARAVLSARPMFFDGGGLTLTGGEASLQFDAALALLRAVRAAGVHAAMETNAAHPRLPELFPHLDLLMADFKHPDALAHKRYTGLDNRLVKQNLTAAVEAGVNLLLRIPLIHSVNDSDEALGGFLAFLAPLAGRGNLRVEILRYHEYGKDKWAQCGMAYQITDGFVDAARAGEFESALRETGIDVVRT